MCARVCAHVCPSAIARRQENSGCLANSLTNQTVSDRSPLHTQQTAVHCTHSRLKSIAHTAGRWSLRLQHYCYEVNGVVVVRSARIYGLIARLVGPETAVQFVSSADFSRMFRSVNLKVRRVKSCSILAVWASAWSPLRGLARIKICIAIYPCMHPSMIHPSIHPFTSI